MPLLTNFSFSSTDGFISPDSSSGATSCHNSSVNMSARSSISEDDEPLEQRSSKPSPPVSESLRSFEGEFRSEQSQRKGQKPKRSISGKVTNCAAGCAADCTALCCCPLTVFHIVGLLCFKFPFTVVTRLRKAAARHRCNRRMRKTMSDTGDGPWTSSPPPFFTRSSSYSEPTPSASMVVPGSGFGDQHFWTHFDSSSGGSSFPSPQKARSFRSRK